MTKSLFNLPDGVEDILPDKAKELEILKRSLLDLYSSKNFELIYPSIIEYADALGGEVNSELKNSAFTFYDDLSSNEIAIRPDISQQIARIDQASNRTDIQKFCYAGEVLKKRKDSFSKSRVTIKAGIETFGPNHEEKETLELLIESFKVAGVNKITLSLGKTEALDELISQCALTKEKEIDLRKLISTKSQSNLEEWLMTLGIDKEIQSKINQLMNCHGNIDTLDKIIGLSQIAKNNVEQLKELATHFKGMKNIDLHFDMTDFPGFNYHKGLVFSAHSKDLGFAIANGGQYESKNSDNKIRNAIGFDIDLISLIKIKKDS
ncbi:MAG: hypothetical protein CMC52_04125 [Flavobacteriaceae bacterium]|jgi:ATP phosphoribosyltransferase regulatory subunit|nr:hypothetical protein [Flavobacteriaceae bacterium]|tara:strand:+ start:628 stop:1590 length:963 start_codon:yes stop_codon:yes gene_type:complete